MRYVFLDRNLTNISSCQLQGRVRLFQPSPIENRAILPAARIEILSNFSLNHRPEPERFRWRSASMLESRAITVFAHLARGLSKLAALFPDSIPAITPNRSLPRHSPSANGLLSPFVLSHTVSESVRLQISRWTSQPFSAFRNRISPMTVVSAIFERTSTLSPAESIGSMLPVFIVKDVSRPSRRPLSTRASVTGTTNSNAGPTRRVSTING